MREFGIEQPISLTLAKISKPNVLEERTGLRPGDTITAVAGQEVQNWWTFADIVRQTLSSQKSMYSDSMMSGTIPADRLIRCNWGPIVGTPKDATATLRVKRPLSG